jgi:hypothetical protein
MTILAHEGLWFEAVWGAMGALALAGVVRHGNEWVQMFRVLRYMCAHGINGHRRWSAEWLLRGAAFRTLAKGTMTTMAVMRLLTLGWPPPTELLSEWSWGFAWWFALLLLVLNLWSILDNRAAQRFDVITSRAEAEREASDAAASH